MPTRRLWWAIVGILAIQVDGSVALAAWSKEVGATGVIQWLFVYCVALPVHRKKDLNAGASTADKVQFICP